MKRIVAVLVAVLSPCIALAQAVSPPHHAKPAAPPASTEAPKSAQPAAAASTDGAAPLYRSPFADYRPFSEELLPKDWRKANDEVRDAGGHVGLMKGAPAQGHGAHGAKQPAPRAPVERK